MTDLKFDLLSKLYNCSPLQKWIDENTLINNYVDGASPFGDQNEAKQALLDLKQAGYVDSRMNDREYKITTPGRVAYETELELRNSIAKQKKQRFEDILRYEKQRSEDHAQHAKERTEDLALHAKERAEDRAEVKKANRCANLSLAISALAFLVSLLTFIFK